MGGGANQEITAITSQSTSVGVLAHSDFMRYFAVLYHSDQPGPARPRGSNPNATITIQTQAIG